MEIGDRILARMAELNLSYRAVAKLVHRSHMTIPGWAHGAAIKEKDLERLAVALETTPGYMRYGKEPETIELDSDLMAEIVAAVTQVITNKGLEIEPNKIGDLVVTLYEIFHESGEVNQGTVSRLINLAE